jgi:ABC-type cobalamin/Fe3+-siderophores transport system ATPase subunit
MSGCANPCLSATDQERPANRDALLNDGRLVEAGPADRVLTSENVTTAFAHPIEVRQHDGRWSARAVIAAVTGS